MEATRFPLQLLSAGPFPRFESKSAEPTSGLTSPGPTIKLNLRFSTFGSPIAVTKTKALAILVIVVGTLLFVRTVYFPPLPPWEQFHRNGLTALRQGNHDEAQRQFQAALKEADAFPMDDWRRTLTLGNLAESYRAQGKFSEAEPHFLRALEIDEQVYGPDHPNVAAHLNNLAGNYLALGKLAEAEPLLKRAWMIWESKLGPDNELVQFARKRYIDLLNEMGRTEEADRLGAGLQPPSP